MPLSIRIAIYIDFGKSWTYSLCALYSRYIHILYLTPLVLPHYLVKHKSTKCLQMSELLFFFAAEATHRLLLQAKEVPHQQLQDERSLAAARSEGERNSHGCEEIFIRLAKIWIAAITINSNSCTFV